MYLKSCSISEVDSGVSLKSPFRGRGTQLFQLIPFSLWNQLFVSAAPVPLTYSPSINTCLWYLVRILCGSQGSPHHMWLLTVLRIVT